MDFLVPGLNNGLNGYLFFSIRLEKLLRKYANYSVLLAEYPLCSLICLMCYIIATKLMENKKKFVDRKLQKNSSVFQQRNL